MPEGKCPKCGKDLTYGALEPGDWGEGFYPVYCNPCGWTGKEYYKMKYIELVDQEGNRYP